MLKPSLVSNKWRRIAYLGRTLVLSLVLATPEVQESASLAIAPTKSSDLKHQLRTHPKEYIMRESLVIKSPPSTCTNMGIVWVLQSSLFFKGCPFNLSSFLFSTPFQNSSSFGGQKSSAIWLGSAHRELRTWCGGERWMLWMLKLGWPWDPSAPPHQTQLGWKQWAKRFA